MGTRLSNSAGNSAGAALAQAGGGNLMFDPTPRGANGGGTDRGSTPVSNRPNHTPNGGAAIGAGIGSNLGSMLDRNKATQNPYIGINTNNLSSGVSNSALEGSRLSGTSPGPGGSFIGVSASEKFGGHIPGGGMPL